MRSFYDKADKGAGYTERPSPIAFEEIVEVSRVVIGVAGDQKIPY